MNLALVCHHRWMAKRKAAGLPYDKPNMVMSISVQVRGWGGGVT